jgi:hypothetical protein
MLIQQRQIALWGALLLSLFFTAQVRAQVRGGAGAYGQPEALAKDFVSAVNSKSADRRKEILHPRTLACINAQTQPFFDWIFSRELKYVIPANYRATTTPLSGGQLLPPEAKSDYPVRPTHMLQIDYSAGPYNSTTIVLFIVKEGSRWHEVLPCPQAEAVEMVKANEAKNSALESRAKRLAVELADPLRAEIISLVKNGHRVDAITRYTAASGEDLAIAKSVVDLLVPRE